GGVGGSEVLGDAGGAKPGGDGPAASGEEGANQKQGQASRRTLLQPVGQVAEGAGQEGRQVRQGHGRLLGTRFPEQESSCPRGWPLSTDPRQPLLDSLATAPNAPYAIALGDTFIRGLRKVQEYESKEVSMCRKIARWVRAAACRLVPEKR